MKNNTIISDDIVIYNIYGTNSINVKYGWMNDAILFASICVYTLAQNCHNRSSTDGDVKRRTAAILILGSFLAVTLQ